MLNMLQNATMDEGLYIDEEATLAVDAGQSHTRQ